MEKTALITGITGQDGSLLADLMLERGHKVIGIIRRNSSSNLGNASHLQSDVDLIEGDIQDLSSIYRIQKSTRPDYFVNCAAQSHVGTSFDQPLYTSMVTGIGVINCLESIRMSGYHTKFLQLSSSEMFGGRGEEALNEESVLAPRSPYATAKCFGHWATINYRESYKMFASNAISFNHEAPGRRGPNFVTRKITLAIASILMGESEHLYLGNIDARRDWGYAEDYCKGFLAALEYKEPDDFVFATGEAHSVSDFCKIAFAHAGLGDYKRYVKIDPMLYRPNDVPALVGDYSKAKELLNWTPEVDFEILVKRMVNSDLKDRIEIVRADPHDATDNNPDMITKFSQSNLA
jgi:GDPmannose 4,6-dehydratase